MTGVLVLVALAAAVAGWARQLQRYRDGGER